MRIIREATPEDQPAMRDLTRRAWQIGYADLLPKPFLDSFGTESAQPRPPTPTDRRQPSLITRLVAETDGTVAGAAMICQARDQDLPPTFGEVAVLNVDPAYWRQGIGRAILTEAETWFRANSMQTIVLWVLAGNHRGRAFYEALRWEPDETERQESLTPYHLPEVRYRKAL